MSCNAGSNANGEPKRGSAGAWWATIAPGDPGNSASVSERPRSRSVRKTVCCWTRKALVVSIWTMLTRSNSVALLPGVLSLLALGCGSSGARAVDGSSDGRSSTSDGAPDSIGRNPDASSKAVATCTTLVWVFGGCTAAVVDECEREYATFPASMATDVDAYAACLLTMVSGVPGGSATGSDAGCPTSSDSLNRWYFHGGCEGNAAQ